MSQVMFVPLGFTPGDREALMSFDKGVCEDLEPFDQFARPPVSWEFPELAKLKSLDVPLFCAEGEANIVLVRKLSDEWRIRDIGCVPNLDLTQARLIEVQDNTERCELCQLPAVYKGIFLATEIKLKYSLSGGTHQGRVYGLCQRCFDLADKLEKIEKKWGM